VLAHAADMAGAALAAALHHRGRVAVRFVTDTELATGAQFTHLSPTGPPGTPASASDRVTLADGTELSVKTLAAVHCRLSVVLPARFAEAEQPDWEYAAAEFHALLVSWLAGLPLPVANRPSPLGLGGPLRDVLSTLALARRAGLPVPDVRAVSRDDGVRAADRERRVISAGLLPSVVDGLRPPPAGPPVGLPALLVPPLRPERCRVLVTGGRVTGPPQVAARWGAACVRLAGMAGLEVCEVLFGTQGQGEEVCLGAEPIPPLSDPAHVAALATYLEERSEQRAEATPP